MAAARQWRPTAVRGHARARRKGLSWTSVNRAQPASVCRTEASCLTHRLTIWFGPITASVTPLSAMPVPPQLTRLPETAMLRLGSALCFDLPQM